jgi:hypothetical protein
MQPTTAEWKDKLNADIERHINEFLASGKTITHVGHGVSGHKEWLGLKELGRKVYDRRKDSESA